METTKRLLLTFKNELNKTVSLSVDDPREDITEAEIKAVMDMIVAKNIFAPKDLDLVTAHEAKIVVTNTTPYDLVIG